MKPNFFFPRVLLAVIALAALPTAVYGQDEEEVDDDHFAAKLREQETVQKTFSVGAGPRSLEIDNVFGSIEVVGTAADQIKVVVNKATRASNQQDLEHAKKEVTLDITQEGNAVRLYVNGPFRCQSNCCDCRRDHREYVVKYDFKVEVPERINLKLRTVNEGKVRVRGVRGDFLVRNVNGPLEIEEVAGSGSARTVNGRVMVSFRENPTAESEFATINGNVDLYFAPKLAADFRFKTMQGAVYSDFPMTQIPLSSGHAERRNGRFVYRADRYTGGRVGEGGPEIKLENLNGDLRVLSRVQ